jgi:hypothetical protein
MIKRFPSREGRGPSGPLGCVMDPGTHPVATRPPSPRDRRRYAPPLQGGDFHRSATILER